MRESRNTILFCHEVSVIGGAERVTLSIIRQVSPDYQPVLLCPPGPLQDAARHAGATVVTVNWFQPDKRSPLNTFLHKRQLISILKRWQPVCVHAGDILAVRAISAACLTLAVPCVVHVHFPYETSFVYWVFKRKTAVNTFIYCSQELMDNIGGYLTSLVPGARNQLIHNGIDIEKFSPSAPAAHNESANEVVHIGIIGNLQQRKGHDDFLNAAKRVVRQCPAVQFHIIGGDILEAPRQPELEALAAQLDLQREVIFHGQVDDVVALAGRLDIVVCASHEEAFPISILEAMAMGKAIVSTNVNGIVEALDEQCSILVPPHAPEQLAEGMIALVKDHEERVRLARNARTKVVENFSDAVFIEKVKQVYKRV